MRPLGFPARLRIKQRREFLRVQRRGRKHHVRHFMVFVMPRLRAPMAPDPIADSGPDSVAEPVADLVADSVADPIADPGPAQIEIPDTRLGITVTRKVGNAVVRNRIKRLVREVFRQHRAQLPPGLDIVWVAKQQAAGASYADVLEDFEALLRRPVLTGPPAARPAKPAKR